MSLNLDLLNEALRFMWLERQMRPTAEGWRIEITIPFDNDGVRASIDKQIAAWTQQKGIQSADLRASAPTVRSPESRMRKWRSATEEKIGTDVCVVKLPAPNDPFGLAAKETS